MVSKERTQELFKGLHDAVVSFDEEAAVELSRAVVEEGVDAYEAVMDGLTAGMGTVGQLFENKEYFVPELLICADTMYAALEVLRPHIKSEVTETAKQRQVVIGVMQGDIHDIGKNLVALMFDTAGWIVHDLGKDTKLERFAEEAMRTNSDVVAISTLMSTTMMALPKVIRMVRERCPNTVIMVGGAPLHLDTAKAYGADGYAESAGKAVKEANELLHRLGKM